MKGKDIIVVSSLVYKRTGLAQCSVDFICISMREAFRKGFRNKPIGFKKWKGYERIRNIQEGNQGIS